jgi:hypothetical protein
VTELFNGTYTTIAGPSANDCNVQVAGALTGKFYGDEAILLPKGANFNPNAQITGDATGTSFFQAFFGQPFPSNYAWQFHYVSDGGTAAATSTWDNTDHGNFGNIA